MAKGKNWRGSKPTAAAGQKSGSSRPTHFLCFPLAREGTVPTFAKTMGHFRDVSTEPPRQPPIRPPSPSPDSQTNPTDPGGNTIDPLGNASRSTKEPGFAESLKVLPSIVHRGPGTLHLTLGVMNLSDSAELQRAIDLLASLDLQQLLNEAKKGPPPGMKSQRKWQEKRGSQLHGVNDDNKVEPEMELVQDETGAKLEASQDSRLIQLESLERPVSPPDISRSGVSSTTPRPLYLSLTGVDAFTSAKKARVIWAKPRAQLPPSAVEVSAPGLGLLPRPIFDAQEADRLYNFALHLHYAFKEAGLINETRQLVLHATLANMRYKVQAKGGRTSKGKDWVHGKKRWEDGLVDVRQLARVFNEYDGDIEAAEVVLNTVEHVEGTGDEDTESDNDTEDDADTKPQSEITRTLDARNGSGDSPNGEYVWCRDIEVDRVAICKMGATKCEDAMWKEWYPPVAERLIFDGI